MNYLIFRKVLRNVFSGEVGRLSNVSAIFLYSAVNVATLFSMTSLK